MQILYKLLVNAVLIAQWVVLAHVIMSWLVNFQVVNLRQPLVASIWNTLQRILEPVYNRVRRFVPTTAGFDFAPLIVLIAIYFVREVLYRNQGLFQ